MQRDAIKVAIEAEHLKRWDGNKVMQPKKGEDGYQAAVAKHMKKRWEDLTFLGPSDIQNIKAALWKGAKRAGQGASG